MATFGKYAVGILGILVVLAGCMGEKPQPVEEAVPVKVFVVKNDSLIRYLAVPAGLEGLQQAHLPAKMPGKLEHVRVRVGQTVEAGAELGNIENATLQQQVAQARSAVNMARSAFEIAEKEYRRMQELSSGRAVSPQQLDQARTRYEQARAQLHQAEAAFRLAREQFRNSLFVAPFRATVAAIYFDSGEFIPAGQPVFLLVSPHGFKADVPIPETYWKDVQIGQTVLATFPDLPGKQYVGTVLWKETAIDPISRTFRARVVLKQTDSELRAGMFGMFRIAVKTVTNMPVVPDNAISSRTEIVIDPQTGQSRYLQKHYVFVVEGGRARRKPVTIALESDTRVAIGTGLQAGDSLIVVGQKLVKDGQPVRVVE